MQYDFVISEFRGLNTKAEDAARGIVLPTITAKNADLRNKVLKPFKNDKSFKKGHVGEITQYGPDILSGKSNYVQLTLNGFQLLIYKDNGQWKRVARKPQSLTNQALVVDSLSQPAPGDPSIDPLPRDESKVKAEPATDGWFYEMGYVLTFVREIDGYRDESAPSGIVTEQNDVLGFRIKRPSAVGPNVKYWNIYRVSTGYRATGAFQKVAELPISRDYFDDYIPGSDLNSVFAGLFDDDGVTVLRQPAPVQFDGICSKLYYGQLIGFKDEVLYFSEPNAPESFPAQYQIKCSSKIVSVETINGDLYAFTESGIQRIIGENPTNAVVLPDYFGYKVANRRASVSTEVGLFYVYKTGVGVINSNGHYSLSRNEIDEDYFKNINMASVHLNYGDGILYIFHSAGTLLYVQDGGVGFIELSNVYGGSFYDRKNGTMLATRENWVWELHNGEESITFQYGQRGLVLNQPDDKRFESLFFYGQGKVNVEIYLDGALKNTRVLDLEGMLRDRTISFPYGENAREASWVITGKGKVTEIKAVLNNG